MKRILLGFGALVIFFAAIGIISGPPEATEPKSEAPAEVVDAFVDEHGEAPVLNPWNGSYPVVRDFLREHANDPASIKMDGCSDIFRSDDGWLVSCRYLGSNAFGGTVRSANWFTVSQGRVAMHPPDAYRVQLE